MIETGSRGIAEHHWQHVEMEWEEQVGLLRGQFVERDYQGIGKSLEVLTELKGWSAVIEEIDSWNRDQLLSVLSPWERSNQLHTKVRDGLFHVMGLESVVGLDIEPLSEFSQFDGFSLSTIRGTIQRHVVGLLRSQISTGNTFYIDTESLRDTALAILLPEIVETRIREILALPDEPHLNDVISTYYGFTILTTVRDVERGRQVFEDLCSSMGKELSIRGTRISYRTRNWHHTSPTTQDLLLNIARLALTKTESPKVDAAKRLRSTGDSRAKKVLEAAKNYVREGRGNTRHPRSYYRDDLGATIDEALMAIGREKDAVSLELQ